MGCLKTNMTEAQELSDWNNSTTVILPFSEENQRAALGVILELPGARLRAHDGEFTIVSAPQKMAWILWELSKRGAQGARYQ